MLSVNIQLTALYCSSCLHRLGCREYNNSFFRFIAGLLVDYGETERPCVDKAGRNVHKMPKYV